MRRLLLPLNLLLAGALVWLGWAVWRQRVERDVWLERRETAARRAVEAKARQQGHVQPRGAPVASPKSLSTGAPTEKPPRVRSPAEIEAGRLGKARVAWQERMNALHGYHTGFTALHLPPETIERAKDILLQNWAANAAAPAKALSVEQRLAVVEQNRREQDAAMIALLGEGPYKELQAYQNEGRFDWTIGTDMWDAGTPLSPEQLHALCLTIGETKYDDRQTLLGEKPDTAPDPATGLSLQDQALLTSTARFLSTEQQQVLRKTLIDENRYTAAWRGFVDKQRAANSGS